MIKKAVLFSLAALALTGCIVSSGTRYHVVDPYLFFNSSARGGIPLMMVGQPYPGRQPGVEAALTTAFKNNFSNYNPPVFTPPSNGPYHRLVIVFNMPGRPTAQFICANTAGMTTGTGAGATDKVNASTAYCGGNEPFSSAWVEFPNPGGPDAPAFVEAMTTLIREAVPRDPDPGQFFPPMMP